MFVDVTVMLAFVLTVRLMLVCVSVGVLPMLLLITVIAWFLVRRLMMICLPFLGWMLVKMWGTFRQCVIVVVMGLVLLAITIILMFRDRRVSIVLCDLGWTVLVSVTVLTTLLLISMRIIAVLPWVYLSAVRSVANLCLCSRRGLLILMSDFLIWVCMLMVGLEMKLAVVVISVLVRCVVLMTVWVSGRLSLDLVVVVRVRIRRLLM